MRQTTISEECRKIKNRYWMTGKVWAEPKMQRIHSETSFLHCWIWILIGSKAALLQVDILHTTSQLYRFNLPSRRSLFSVSPLLFCIQYLIPILLHRWYLFRSKLSRCTSVSLQLVYEPLEDHFLSLLTIWIDPLWLRLLCCNWWRLNGISLLSDFHPE